MTNKLPDSSIVQQFRKFLDKIEVELNETLEQIEELKAEDPEMGYPRAVGCAKARIRSLQISAKITREFYLDA
jgi:hypothetical protein